MGDYAFYKVVEEMAAKVDYIYNKLIEEERLMQQIKEENKEAD